MPVTLTDRVVQQAKAGDARKEIADAVVPSLYLIVQPTGVKSWAVRYRIGRHTRKLTLRGRYPVLSLKKARDEARAALESVSAGGDPATAKCQSALDRDPISASKKDPFERRVLAVALAPSELAGVAETARARVA